MEGKINSEDPVFVSEHHVSITYHRFDLIFIFIFIHLCLFAQWFLSLKHLSGY